MQSSLFIALRLRNKAPNSKLEKKKVMNENRCWRQNNSVLMKSSFCSYKKVKGQKIWAEVWHFRQVWC